MGGGVVKQVVADHLDHGGVSVLIRLAYCQKCSLSLRMPSGYCGFSE
jgi:hypothetical protein